MGFRELSGVGTTLGRWGLAPGGAGRLELAAEHPRTCAACLSFVASRAGCVLSALRSQRLSTAAMCACRVPPAPRRAGADRPAARPGPQVPTDQLLGAEGEASRGPALSLVSEVLRTSRELAFTNHRAGFT